MLQNLVKEGYLWEAPFFDAHHLYGVYSDFEYETDESNFLKGLKYTDEEREKIQTLHEFHGQPFNQIGIPRIAHDAIHWAFLTAGRPSYEVMRRENKKARRTKYLHRVVTNAIAIHESLGRITRQVDTDGNVMWTDKIRRRTYQGEDVPELLQERRDRFVRQILYHYQKGYIDLSHIAPLELVDKKVLTENMKGTVKVLDEGLIAIHNQKILDVNLPTRSIPMAAYKKGKSLPDAA